MQSEIEGTQALGAEEMRALGNEAAVLMRKKESCLERLKAAEEDRAKLFAEAQSVEKELQCERERKAKAQATAAHYRTLLERIM